MCGIVGYIGKKEAQPILLNGLKRLEYRGYDSSGVAIYQEKQKGVANIKAVGNVASLEKKCVQKLISGNIGLAHTRWATHGRPTVRNAHPHTDCQRKIWLAHNGIIENYQEIKKELIKKKHCFKSETDSEVLAHLIEEESKNNNFLQAVQNSLKQINGTYGLVVFYSDEPDKFIAARRGSPLLIGIGKNENIIASDMSAIALYTKKVICLSDGEIAIIKKDSVDVLNIQNAPVKKKVKKIDPVVGEISKENFPNFMLKEIFEQPQSVVDSLRGRLIKNQGKAKLGGLEPVTEKLRNINRVIIAACGTARFAGLVGEYMFEEYGGIPTEVEYASEFRYRRPIIDKKTVLLAISQSGETADTLAAVREAKEKGALTLGIVNVVGSTIARETDAGIFNHAGPEIGVASTKAFTSQLIVLALMALFFGRQRQLSLAMGKEIASELEKIPGKINQVLKNAQQIKKIAQKYKDYKNFVFLGRKYNFPIALEASLKLKEISYLHSEGYAAGEMKHGSIALIDKKLPTIVIVPKDSVYDKVLNNLEEIKARGGPIIAITTAGDKKIRNMVDEVIYIPKTLEMLLPILTVIPLQLFAYYFGIQLGYDVDKPRNLAKSVTVE